MVSSLIRAKRISIQIRDRGFDLHSVSELLIITAYVKTTMGFLLILRFPATSMVCLNYGVSDMNKRESRIQWAD